MQITIKNTLTLFWKLTHHFLDIKNNRMNYLRRILPAAIKVLTTQRASIITINYTINIDHWDYSKDEVFSQCPCFQALSDQKFYNTLHHPRGVTFTWMNTCWDKNTFLGFCLRTIWILVFARDGYHITSVSSQCSAQYTPMEKVVARFILLDPC